MSKYSTLPDHGQVKIYMDDNERKDVVGVARYSVVEWIILVTLHILWVFTLPATWWCSFKVIPQHERAIIYRLGRLQRAKGPGLIYILPCIDRWKKVDMRMKAFNVPPQEVFTIDGGLIKIGADVQYRVCDPMASFNELQDLNATLRVAAVSALNNALAGKKSLEIKNEKNYLNAVLQNVLNRNVRDWGLEIARFELAGLAVLRKAKGTGDDVIVPYEDPLQSVLATFKGLNPSASPAHPMMPSSMPSSSALPPGALTPEELFAMLKSILTEELVERVNAVFQFNLSGNNGGSWCLDLRNGDGFVGKGPAPCDPDVTLSMAASDFQRMLYKKMTPTDAYMAGKVKIDGDFSATSKLEEVIKCLTEHQSSF